MLALDSNVGDRGLEARRRKLRLSVPRSQHNRRVLAGFNAHFWFYAYTGSVPNARTSELFRKETSVSTGGFAGYAAYP
jgi:hypothetical protein